MLVTLNDFTQGGKYELHTGPYDQQRLQSYIDKYERRYLVELLGVDLYNEFQADVIAGGGYPTQVRFVTILESLFEDYNWTIIYSEGMVEMLKGFIWYEYTKDGISQVTPVGMVTPSAENSRNANTLYMQMYTRYNDACRTYKAIQEYITNNSSTYSEFNGMRKMLITYL